MDRNYVVQHNLVERYLRGELDESTREAFEIHFLEDAETLRELQVYEALREGMRQLAADESLPPLVATKPAQTGAVGPALVAANQSWFRGPGLAACFALVAVASTSLWQIERHERQEVESQLATWAGGETSILDLRRQRGVLENKSTRYNPAPGAMLVLNLEPPQRSAQDLLAGTEQSYRVSISAAREGVDVAGLPIVVDKKPNDTGSLIVSIPFQQIPAGEYSVDVLGLEDGSSGMFLFTVESPQSGTDAKQ